MILIVMGEAVIAIAVAYCVWKFWRRKPHVFFLFPLVGFAWVMLYHGVFSLFERVPPSSPFSGLDWFFAIGLAFGLYIGLPVGVLAMIIGLIWYFATHKPGGDKYETDQP